LKINSSQIFRSPGSTTARSESSSAATPSPPVTTATSVLDKIRAQREAGSTSTVFLCCHNYRVLRFCTCTTRVDVVVFPCYGTIEDVTFFFQATSAAPVGSMAAALREKYGLGAKPGASPSTTSVVVLFLFVNAAHCLSCEYSLSVPRRRTMRLAKMLPRRPLPQREMLLRVLQNSEQNTRLQRPPLLILHLLLPCLLLLLSARAAVAAQYHRDRRFLQPFSFSAQF
jgi:hypothetical protein